VGNPHGATTPSADSPQPLVIRITSFSDGNDARVTIPGVPG
jgi:hypothetical protein